MRWRKVAVLGTAEGWNINLPFEPACLWKVERFFSPVPGCILWVSPSSWLWFSFVLSLNWVISLKHWKNYPVNGGKKRGKTEIFFCYITELNAFTFFDRKTAQLGKNQTKRRAEDEQGEEKNCNSSGITHNWSLRSIEWVEKDSKEEKNYRSFALEKGKWRKAHKQSCMK